MLLTRIFYAGVAIGLWLPLASHAGNGTEIKIDPALPVFIQQVWTESPIVQGARAAMDAAQARTDGAGRPLHNPSLELDVERTDINTSSIGLSQTLDWSNKRGAQLTIAKQRQQGAQAAVWEARRSTAQEALNALVDFFTAHESWELAQHRSLLMQTLVNTARQRQAAGDVNALDVILAQVTYNESLMLQATAENTLTTAESALQAVSGLAQTASQPESYPQWPSLPDDVPAAPTQIDPSTFEALPKLIMLRSRVAAAKARISLAKKQGRSDPTLGIRAGKENTETLYGLSLEIPLFVRNNFSAETRVAAHQAVVEEQAYRNAYRRAKAHLTATFTRYKNTYRAWRAWLTDGQRAQREQMNLLNQLWHAGELSVTDYLIQAKQNIDTQETATQLLGETRRAHFAWLAASNQVENWLGLVQQNIETNSGESQ